MSDAVRNRLRLWLRSERALGLTSVAAPTPLALVATPRDAIEVVEVESAGEAEQFESAEQCEPVPTLRAAPAIASPQAPAPAASGASSLFVDEQPTALVMPSPEALAFEA